MVYDIKSFNHIKKDKLRYSNHIRINYQTNVSQYMQKIDYIEKELCNTPHKRVSLLDKLKKFQNDNNRANSSKNGESLDNDGESLDNNCESLDNNCESLDNDGKYLDNNCDDCIGGCVNCEGFNDKNRKEEHSIKPIRNIINLNHMNHMNIIINSELNKLTVNNI